jgi:DNA polymerase-3 subunit gamma/tau
MADPATSPDGVASLYRRFRPGRFAEIRGQEHIVRALQGAVAHDRVVHAYLFSGPRGTGKTTTARILAKALNCEHADDGDACNRCASCLAITRGTSLDVVELDAASNNGVEDIREITAGAWHGTPGRWKVYIIDEVHMLSKAAEAAFLKTLEEPPTHVVFVLATTDPHRVVATIRSRTQHLEFRLLSAATLNSLLHEVRDAAGLELDEATLATAVRMGHGSARDALSALDQVVATGSLSDAAPPFDDLLGALATQDAVGSLTALAELARLGWDPEQLAESLAGELRQVFLLLVAPDASDALDLDRERLSAWGREMGLPRTVRCLETLGRTLREMRGSPVPAVMLEVALVRLTRPELDDSVAALEERLARLERSQVQGAPASALVAPPASRPIGALARTPVASALATVPSAASRSSAQPSTGTPSTENPSPENPSPGAAADPPEPASRTGAPAPRPDEPEYADELTLEGFIERFTTRVVPRLSRTAQIFLGTSQVRSLHGAVLTITVPSESMRESAEKIQSGLRSALEHEFRTIFQITWAVDAATETSAPVTGPTPREVPNEPPEPVDTLDDAEIAEAEVRHVESVASLLIAEAFPGAEEIS